jgi:cytochrome c oxidase subunit 2
MIGKFQLLPDQASTMAVSYDWLFLYLLAVTVFFTAIIFVLVLGFAIKYRRSEKNPVGQAVHPSMALEVAWIVIPFGLVMIMFGWGVAIFVRAGRPPSNAMEVDVVGKQWMWKIQHPDGQREINALHVPVGQPVKLVMTSQDVIHDFAVPAFRMKMDVVPGRYTTEWFEATKPGEYHIFCDQYCGTQHAGMIGKVVVMEADKYQAWLAGTQVGETTAQAGAQLFAKYSCMTCHSQQAPTMSGLYGSKVAVWQDGKKITVTADDDYIRDSIVNPNHQIVDGYQPLMPSFQGILTEDQILQLVAYIKTLGQQGGRVDMYKMNNRYAAPEDQSVPGAPPAGTSPNQSAQ